jgi:GH15 family glucan-1,4-alpha-glucosidase
MASYLENYGFISNLHGSALVSRDGSVDWLCMPAFDSAASMAALLGRDEHGCWSIYPAVNVRRTQRRYRPGTLILETELECDGGIVRLVDFMPLVQGQHALVRIVEGVEGTVPLHLSLIVRFGYGNYTPYINEVENGIDMITAPNALILRTSAPVKHNDRDIFGELTVKKGDRVTFELSWHGSASAPPPALDIPKVLAQSEQVSREWGAKSKYSGRYSDIVNQSLIVLKGMIYHPSGGIVAAPTAGLPEEIGGVRNWDYRYCWLRDATLTLDALMLGGFVDEAIAWRTWLRNAIAGAPEDLQIMYGILGERRLTEYEASWLPGYEESRPVRIGNAASEQFQLDVYGEVVQALYEARRLGVPEQTNVMGPAKRFMEFVSKAWQRPDDGIWEVRGGRRHFVHSKMMAWVAVDRFIRIVEEFNPPNHPFREEMPRFHALRDRIHRDVCEHGYDRQQNAFTQSYGRPELDASVLLMPAVGFLPASDPRVQGTIKAIEKNLLEDGFVMRYRPEATGDGLTGTEGAFLACSFWLVDAYAYSNRNKDAEKLFERLASLRNDLGLLAEEYDTKRSRMIGNFPQAFSHLALIHSASVLSNAELTPRAGMNGHKAARGSTVAV